MDEDNYRVDAIYYDGAYNSRESLADIPYYVKEETTSLKMVSYTPPQLRLLCELNSLKVVETFGSFGRTPLDNEASNIIFKVRKA